MKIKIPIIQNQHNFYYKEVEIKKDNRPQWVKDYDKYYENPIAVMIHLELKYKKYVNELLEKKLK